jgi:uncharacterized protein
MELTPQAPRGLQLIQAYGDGRFRISGTVYHGSVLVTPGRSFSWDVSSLAALAPRELFDSLWPLLAEMRPEILLLGCGPQAVFALPETRALFKEQHAVLEPMDTGAACRTYNVLVAEERHVAAALIAV